MIISSLACQMADHKHCSAEGCRCVCHPLPDAPHLAAKLANLPSERLAEILTDKDHTK